MSATWGVVRADLFYGVCLFLGNETIKVISASFIGILILCFAVLLTWSHIRFKRNQHKKVFNSIHSKILFQYSIRVALSVKFLDTVNEPQKPILMKNVQKN